MQNKTFTARILCATLALTLCLTGCAPKTPAPVPSQPAPSEAVSQAASSEATSEPEADASAADSASTPPAAAPAGMGENLDVFQISLDGTVFTFPGSTFADFAAAGWEIDAGAKGASLQANSVTRAVFSKGEATVELHALNQTAAALAFEECSCIGLDISSPYKVPGIEVILPGGLTMEATTEEVLAKYGEPREQYKGKETGEILSLTYGPEAAEKYAFSFFENKISGITIYNSHV